MHAACWKYRTQKSRKNRHLRAITPLCRAISSQLKHLSTIGKKLLSSNISSRCPPQYCEVWPTNGWDRFRNLGHSSKFQRVSRLGCYFSDVTHWRPTKPCMTFGCLLGWYTIYTFLGALRPEGILPGAKFTLRPKSCVLLYWQRYCTALEQLASAKICGVLQGMELRNCCRGCHLYSAGRPSRWASAHILVAFEKIVTGNSLVKDMVYGRQLELPQTVKSLVGLIWHSGDHLFKNVGDIQLCLKINHSVVWTVETS